MFLFVKKSVIVVWILLFTVNFAFAMEIKNLSQAVDVAGKQRMFTQRMLKDYAMVGLKNTFGKPEKDLKNIMSAFEDHLDSLISFNSEEKTKVSLEKVKALWGPVKKALAEAPSKDKAGKMQESLEALLGQANEATGLFAKQTGKVSGEIINIAGRQRMLSQRMASLYMLKVWGVNDPKFADKMDKAMNLFKVSLDKLIKYEENTPKILSYLNKAKKAFMYFEFMNKTDNVFVPALIYKKSMDILKNMNTATGLYAAIEK